MVCSLSCATVTCMHVNILSSLRKSLGYPRRSETILNDFWVCFKNNHIVSSSIWLQGVSPHSFSNLQVPSFLQTEFDHVMSEHTILEIDRVENSSLLY